MTEKLENPWAILAKHAVSGRLYRICDEVVLAVRYRKKRRALQVIDRHGSVRYIEGDTWILQVPVGIDWDYLERLIDSADKLQTAETTQTTVATDPESPPTTEEDYHLRQLGSGLKIGTVVQIIRGFNSYEGGTRLDFNNDTMPALVGRYGRIVDVMWSGLGVEVHDHENPEEPDVYWWPYFCLRAIDPNNPPAPEGYRRVDPEVDSRKRAGDLFWDSHTLSWEPVDTAETLYESLFYARPLADTAYRPFASAEEFHPYRERWVREESRVCKVQVYSDEFVEVNTRNYSWDEALAQLQFADDNLPFGLPRH